MTGAGVGGAGTRISPFSLLMVIPKPEQVGGVAVRSRTFLKDGWKLIVTSALAAR